MLTDSSQSYILANLPVGKAKKCEKPCAGLMVHFKAIFNKLVVNIQNIPPVLCQLLQSLVKENGFLQNDYFSLFEINRMKFGPFGTIREMNAQRCKLILGGVFIIRVFIYYFIMHPWEVFGQDKSKFKIDKLLNMGSIMYNMVMMIFKGSIPINANNQNFLSNDTKTRHKKTLQQAVESEKEIKIEKDLKFDTEIIDGFYTNDQLASFFEHNKKLSGELRQVVAGFLDIFTTKVCSS